ncbi:SRPBCC family protein [Hymenobacter busanensis]|nr:SRPBCC family protein [Hymenobacter busanensis]QHJ06238.1 hypothetical protein GUY19_02565 [Hymenobacter busanensis]
MHTLTDRAVVTVERSISIAADAAQVFAFAADLRNDAAWRAEVHGTQLNTAQPGPGSIATEDAFLSAKRPHSLTQLHYVAYEPSRYMHCTTATDAPVWMSVERTFRAHGLASTEFVYSLTFETRLVQEALGFAPPRWFLRWYTGLMMGRYQRQLKRLMEKR